MVHKENCTAIMMKMMIKSYKKEQWVPTGECLKFVWFACWQSQIFLWVAKMTSFSKGLKRMLIVDDGYTSYLHTTMP